MAKAEISIKAEVSSHREISTVVARSQRGDEEAFRHLFRRYSKPVLDFIFNMTSDRSLAEELTQETFVRAYKSLANLRDTAKFSTWLFGIAKNIVKAAIKAKYVEGQRVALDEPVSLNIEDTNQKPDDAVLSAELNSAIRRVLQEINEDWRTVFILKFVNQQSYEEIAEITGWTIGKIKMDLHRARLELRRRLQNYFAK